MWKRLGKNRELTCQQVEEELTAYLKGGLSGSASQAIRSHLASCDACAASLRNAELLDAELYAQAARHRPALSPRAAGRIQEQIYRRIRRGLIVERATQFTGGVVGLAALLALIIAILAVWLWVPQEGDGRADPVVTRVISTPDGGALPTLAPLALTPGASDVENDLVTIRFAVEEWHQAGYQELVKAFDEENPGIKIKMVSIEEILNLGPAYRGWPENAWAKLASAADVIQMHPSQEAVQAGLIKDLTPFIAADPGFQWDEFYPNALATCRWAFGTWCLPTGVDLDLIFFSKDTFDEAGVPYPEPGWTWDDFLSTASALTVREGDQVEQWGFAPRPYTHQAFIEGQVGPLLDTTSYPPTPHFDRPEVMDAVRRYTELFLEHEVAPHSLPPGELERLILGGKVAMWPESYLAWPVRVHNPGVVPFPGSTRLSGLGTASISAGTAHPEAAWRWLKALDQADEVTYNRSLPARRSTAEASGFWEDVDGDVAAALRYALEHSYVTAWSPRYETFPSLTEWSYSFKAFADAIDAVLSAKVAVDAALGGAQKGAEAEIDRALDRLSKITPATPIAVAPLPDEATAGPDATIIRFTPASAATSYDLEPYRNLARQFGRTHPDIKVELNLPRRGYDMVTMQDLAEDADCFSWPPWFQEPGSLEAILNLDPFLDADPAFSTDDFYPELWRHFTWEGPLWGLPGYAKPEIIKYNKELFDAAGLDYPALDWTLDDLTTSAIALTRGEGEEKQYGFVGAPLEAIDLTWMLQRQGVDLIDDSEDPPTLILNSAAAKEGLRWYTDLTIRYGAKPAFFTDWSDLTQLSSAFTEKDTLVKSGRAAMWTILESYELLTDPDGLDVGVATLPAGAEGYAGAYSYVEGYFISASSDYPQACWEWITFLTGQPEIVRGVPARRSVVHSDAYREQVGAERAAVFEASVAGGYLSTRLQPVDQSNYASDWMFGGVVLLLSKAYGQVVAGEASVEAALEAAQGTFEDYRACVISREAFSDDEKMLACMKEADPSLPTEIFGR
jgi:multiple sugar transport system substrate-binding protein